MLSTRPNLIDKEGVLIEDGIIVRWKEVGGFPNYIVYENGKVWSKLYERGDSRFLKERLNRGYVSVLLYGDGFKKNYYLHRLVALHFVDGYEEGLTVNHKDCNKLNNHYTNLEWVTQKENVAHALDNGLIKNRRVGEDHPRAKIKEEDVREIRRLHATGLYTHKQIAIMYGKDRSSVSDIINRDSWKHVD